MLLTFLLVLAITPIFALSMYKFVKRICDKFIAKWFVVSAVVLMHCISLAIYQADVNGSFLGASVGVLVMFFFSMVFTIAVDEM